MIYKKLSTLLAFALFFAGCGVEAPPAVPGPSASAGPAHDAVLLPLGLRYDDARASGRTANGYYYTWRSPSLTYGQNILYIDYASLSTHFLSSDAQSLHSDPSDTSFLPDDAHGSSLFTANEGLYYMAYGGEYIGPGRTEADPAPILYGMDLNGQSRRVVRRFAENEFVETLCAVAGDTLYGILTRYDETSAQKVIFSLSLTTGQLEPVSIDPERSPSAYFMYGVWGQKLVLKRILYRVPEGGSESSPLHERAQEHSILTVDRFSGERGILLQWKGAAKTESAFCCGKILLTSAGENAIHCLNAETGEEERVVGLSSIRQGEELFAFRQSWSGIQLFDVYDAKGRQQYGLDVETGEVFASKPRYRENSQEQSYTICAEVGEEYLVMTDEIYFDAGTYTLDGETRTIYGIQPQYALIGKDEFWGEGKDLRPIAPVMEVEEIEIE